MKRKAYDQYSRIDEGKLEAWHTGGDFRAGKGGSQWNIAEDGYTIATVEVTTTRKITPAAQSLSGYTHVSIRTDVRLTLRLLGYRCTYTLAEPFCWYGGPRTALRKAMRMLHGSTAWTHARLDLEAEARKAGHGEFELLNAWDAREDRHAWNLWRILNPAADD